MLRGFATTLAVVSCIMMGAWAYAEQARMASATPVPAVTPLSEASATTNSNVAAKGDRLAIGPQFAVAGYADQDGSMKRIVEAHARAMQESAQNRSMTIGLASGPRETTLMRVSVAD